MLFQSLLYGITSKTKEDVNETKVSFRTVSVDILIMRTPW